MTTPPTLSEMRKSLETQAELQHADAGPTIQDVFDKMTQDQKDLVATIVGAALENTSLSDYPEIVDAYNALPDEYKRLVEFTVGNLLAEDSALKHDAMWESETLEHHGVKGMKWGVIRDGLTGGPGRLSKSAANTPEGRAAANAAVSRGKATVKQAHLASLKSNGHRAINALSGDKTFWRRMAITAGITTAVAAAPIAGAWLLPAGVLGALGGSALSLGTGAMSAVEAGQWTLGMAAVYGALGTAAAGTAGNVVGNTARAVAGNTLINKSYARVGKELATRQKTGRERINNALKGAAGIRDKDLLKHEFITPPTLSEMTHILETQDDVLEHFGIKGMKWGIRRSPKTLASIRNGDGDEVGTLSGGRKIKEKLKNMRAGQVALLDTDDGPMITIKQKDGTFREVKLSADQEGVLRTMRKDPTEMSTRELKEATARAKALDDYNKLFNPSPDANQALKDKVEAMELQMKYGAAYSKMNPSATKRATDFIETVKPTAFSAWKMANKVTNNALNDNIAEMIKSMTEPTPARQRPSKGTRASQRTQAKTAAQNARSQKKTNDFVYDITSMGKDDYMNPFVPAIEARRS